MALAALQVKNAKPGRHSDGNGLFLLVRPSGSASWVLRVQTGGQRREYGLGSSLGLSEARDRAKIWRGWAKDGKDPRREWAQLNEAVPTFADAAGQCYDVLRKGWREGKHQEQWWTTLERHVFPRLGKLSVDAIGAPEVLSVLRPIWHEIPETAARVRQRIGKVLDYAYSQSWRDDATPMRAIAAGLGKHDRSPDHFPAVPYDDIPALWGNLVSANAGQETVGRSALMWTLLNAARPGETRGMAWGEIDLDAETWTVPASRHKTKTDHVVPLTGAALDLLREWARLVPVNPGALVFPGTKPGRPISDATMNRALARVGWPEYTVHGLRSSFRDWAGEKVRARREVSEAALSHTLSDKTERAYARATYLDERRELMGRWADFVTGAQCTVVHLAERQPSVASA